MSPSTHSCGSRPAGEGESERGGAGAAEGLPGRWRGSRGAAGGGGRGRAVARRPAGSSREPAGRAEPEPQPERGGGGRSQSGRRLCRRSRGAATLAPRPPPRSLALTPGRRRRAARAPPAPHGRPRHWALRPPRRCPARSSAPRRVRITQDIGPHLQSPRHKPGTVPTDLLPLHNTLRGSGDYYLNFTVPERSHCSRRRPRENTERSLPTHPPLSPQEPLICFRSLHAVPVPERHALHAVDERVHCADTLACSFICGRAQGCLHLLAAVNSVVIRIHVQALSEHLFRCCGAGTQQRNG
ncbi:uncharacterized protein LOC108590274 isoform X5 [Callithrix jacchus]|uniref:5E5 antigen-like isoform X7 n=1 Tax=Callithrix jacchus TaxID=9483 RepID=UPI00159DD6D8|nr:5E5 antigen-like isoform X7 [Callithrix jacchus]